MEQLKNTVLFRKLSANAWQKIQQILQLQELSTNTIVTSAGNPGDSLYFIVEGSVLVSMSAEETELPVLLLKKGEYFGELSVLQPGSRLVSTKTADNTVLAKISHNNLESIRVNDPQAHWEFVQILIKLNSVKSRVIAPQIATYLGQMTRSGKIGPGHT